MSKIRFGILGPGKISHRFVKGVTFSQQAVITAVGGRDFQKTLAYARKYDIGFVTDYQGLCDCDVVDAIYIALPPPLHKEWIIKALSAGKHVICEKPMVYSIDDLNDCFNLAESLGLFLMEAQKTVFLPTTQKVKEWINQGKLGDISYIEAGYCYKFSDESDHWVFDADHGGGSLFDVGVYPLCYALALFGCDITSVSVQKKLLSGGSDGFAHMQLKFDSGIIASISSAIVVEGLKEARIYGSEGYIVVPDFWKTSNVELIRYDGNDEVFFVDQPSEFTHYIDHSCDCIKKGLSESPILTKAFNETMIRLITSK
ncbi:MAG: Gfo/Idh/MocA family oxidoreductase [Erysipelothrix sp.]|nr:Gfo/Idh/MocA family oxidoreductase [Erysipelothrix sp.]